MSSIFFRPIRGDERTTPRAHFGLPLGFARSALFSVQERTGKTLQRVKLPSGPGIELTYTGPRLHQQHNLVWQAVVSLLLEQHAASGDAVLEGPQQLATNRRKLLDAAGKRDDTSRTMRSWVWDTLTELQSGQIELRTQRQRFSDSLLGALTMNEDTGAISIAIDARMIDLLRDEVAVINLKRKATLGRSQLALWLHDFISTQSNDQAFPWPVKELHRLCGSAQAVPQFRQRLRTAAARLTKGTDPLLTTWHIDKHDRLVFTKIRTLVVLLPDQAKAFQLGASRHEQDIEAAKAQRQRVLL
jgi:hypothetical protein